jgi:hypothetical protein
MAHHVEIPRYGDRDLEADFRGVRGGHFNE